MYKLEMKQDETVVADHRDCRATFPSHSAPPRRCLINAPARDGLPRNRSWSLRQR